MSRLTIFSIALLAGCGTVSDNGGGADLAMNGVVDMATSGGEDGPPTGCVEGAACMAGTSKSICHAGVCGACTDGDDNAACTAAYGSATTHYTCTSGACAQAACTTSADCAGKLCRAGACVACGGDSDCAADATYSAAMKTSCQAADGTCVASTCANEGQPCASNSDDVCCSGMCVPGNCCGSGSCTPSGGAAGSGMCESNQCAKSGCPAVTGNDYYVDATAGDANGNGANMAGCQFDKIANAVNAINSRYPTGAPAGTTIHVKGDFVLTATVQIPGNVKLIGDSGTVPNITWNAACATPPCPVPNFFHVSKPGTVVQNFSLDGGHLASSTGVHVTGTSDGTSSLSSLTIKNMQKGIWVDGGDTSDPNIVIANAVNVSGCSVTSGTTTNGSGMRIDGGGQASINLASGEKSSFNNNNFGIYISDNNSRVIINSKFDYTAKTARLDIKNNAHDGIWMNTGGRTSLITGVDISGHASGSAIHATQGNQTGFRVLNSSLLGNKFGIYIDGKAGDTFGKISVGDGTENNRNLLQDVNKKNTGTGVCIDFQPVSGAPVLVMSGNVFAGKSQAGVDCVTQNAGLWNTTTCAPDSSAPTKVSDFSDHCHATMSVDMCQAASGLCNGGDNLSSPGDSCVGDPCSTLAGTGACSQGCTMCVPTNPAFDPFSGVCAK